MRKQPHSPTRAADPHAAEVSEHPGANMHAVFCGVCPPISRDAPASARVGPRDVLGAAVSAPATCSAQAAAPLALDHDARRRRGLTLRASALPPEAVEAGFAASDAVVDTFAARSMADAVEGTGVAEWQLWFGLWIGLSPFVIAAYEFGKRILIQRQCELCKGSGLIQKGKYMRKCSSCGGFLPWQSWQQFLSSEAGNGGVLRAPKGQTSVFYDVEASRRDGERQAAAVTAAMRDEGTVNEDEAADERR